MALNKNIFFPTNPAHTADALWKIIDASNVPLADILIFLPSRRAVRTVEEMLVQKMGHAIILPHMVALGEGVDEADEYEPAQSDTVSNTERVVTLARLLSEEKTTIGNISTALPIAHDLVRMTDYLENEGVDVATINWIELVDEKFAEHFQNKAKLLNILSANIDGINRGFPTTTAKRNADIREWIPFLKNPNCKYKLAIVCGSTASVPATSDLMATIAELPFGKIILSGKIAGREADFELPTNPYHSEYKFLNRIGYKIKDIQPIDVGASDTIDFMNFTFGNDTAKPKKTNAVSHCHLVECERESTEALAVAEITARALKNKKSVLVITPDAAGNQRIAAAFASYGISADFSGGRPATMHAVGRAILNLFDEWIEKQSHTFDDLYKKEKDLFKIIQEMVDARRDIWFPSFNPTDEAALPIWTALQELSEALKINKISLTVSDARAFIADTLSSVVIRATPTNDAHTCVLGTIESRMQTADVIILTGLNDGMFPSTGYENAWLPRVISEEIGLPSPNHKVSLMSLDFMNLSCGADVYWLRSKISGGVQTTESRFLSRVVARGGEYDTQIATDILSVIHARDDVELRPLDYSAPTPPVDWSDVYVTELELLIHNPYAFYARHILRLRPIDDYWLGPDARKFGTLVHDAFEHARPTDTAEKLVARMDAAANEALGSNGVLFHFWHKRFLEIAPFIVDEIKARPDAYSEISGSVKIPVGDGGASRTVRARADRVCDDMVIDIKTGAAPSQSQLLAGTMPQLPLEAYMLQSGGFKIKTTQHSKTPVMMFLQLRNNDVKHIEYDAETTQRMIDAAVDKTKQLFNMYCAGNAPYEYLPTSEQKYKTYDDLARVDDL